MQCTCLSRDLCLESPLLCCSLAAANMVYLGCVNTLFSHQKQWFLPSVRTIVCVCDGWSRYFTHLTTRITCVSQGAVKWQCFKRQAVGKVS